MSKTEIRFDPWAQKSYEVKKKTPKKAPPRPVERDGGVDPWTGDARQQKRKAPANGAKAAATAATGGFVLFKLATALLSHNDKQELDYSYHYGDDGYQYWDNPEGHLSSGPSSGDFSE